MSKKQLYANVANSVLLIPGLGGSILKVRFFQNLKKTELVWPRLFKANEYCLKYLSGKINPETLEIESAEPVFFFFF
jgi:hypothetical protein